MPPAAHTLHAAQVKNGKTFLDLIAEQIKHTRQKYGAWRCLQCPERTRRLLAGGRRTRFWAPGACPVPPIEGLLYGCVLLLYIVMYCALYRRLQGSFCSDELLLHL